MVLELYLPDKAAALLLEVPRADKDEFASRVLIPYLTLPGARLIIAVGIRRQTGWGLDI
jgi:hypothetical protein